MSSSPSHVVALILARGGSKGIPRKNVRALVGKPLIALSIETARRTREIAETFVSTDDREIADVARHYGATVIERPAELANDTASSEAALVHALDVITRDRGEPRAVVFMQPTSPLRRDDELSLALRTFEQQDADSLFTATTATGFMWRATEGRVRPMNYDPGSRPRRQDAPVDVIENGSFYIFKPAVLREHKSRLGGRIAVHMMPMELSFQIDEPWDFELMEWLASRQARQGGSIFQASLMRLSEMARQVASSLEPAVVAAGACLAECIAGGGKILACGNGGSAADAQHFVAELVGRLNVERRALPGISLSSDPSVVTCLANDYGYDQLFARQVEALGRTGDALLAISTSGTSPNVLNAARVAKQHGIPVVSLTGARGDALAALSDHCVRIPTSDTQCIQELHMAVLHVLCASIDKRIVG
jgi:CMP-N,N'-diacetyllegionaminic acid synthase